MIKQSVFSARPAVVTIALALSMLGVSWAQELPIVRSTTLIDGTPDTFRPGTGVANLDGGDLIAGSTRYDHDGDGVIFNETRVGFLWTPLDGMQVFDITDELYWSRVFQISTDVANDETVCGSVIFRVSLENKPFRWTPANGFEFLELPGPGWNGGAVAISGDGSVIGGAIQLGIGTVPTSAATWTGGVLETLPTRDPWSSVFDVSDDGSVVVGSSGGSRTQISAARWVGGMEDKLRSVGETSVAQFTSADGKFAIGTATLRNGRSVLVRWDDRGRARVFRLPKDLATIETVNAINPTATAAVGAVSKDDDWAPFLWTLDGGFVVIGELGREADYDLSQATGVSDDGTTVIGDLRARVVFNGDPPQLAFYWREDLGTVTIDDILANSGFADTGFYFATAISNDALRILAVGNPKRTVFDTNSLLIELEP